MKNLFLFAVIASLLFTVSCSKTELKPNKELTGIDKLKEMAGEQGTFVKSINKSDKLSDFEGNLYTYYPDENNLTESQDIFVTSQKTIDDIIKANGSSVVKVGDAKFVYLPDGTIGFACDGIGYDCVEIFGVVVVAE